MLTIVKKLSVVLVTLGLAGPAFAADVKIGYIDIKKALQGTSAGKAAQKELEGIFEKKKVELQKLEADIKKMKDDYEKKRQVLSEEVRQEKEMALQNEMLKYRDQMNKSQMELANKEKDLTAPIIDKIQKAIAKIAEDGKYTMILEKSEQSVLWAQKDIDVTDAVIKAVEKK